MKIIELTVRFKCNEDIDEKSVADWMDDLLDLTADYDAFEEATGYAIDELPEVVGVETYIETGG